jgi:small conductance mechanosensitive channel
MSLSGRVVFRLVGLAVKGFTMKSAWKAVRHVSLWALLLVLLGSGVAAAAASDPNAAASGAHAGTNPFSFGSAQGVLDRVYTLLAEYGFRVLGAVLIFVVGRWVAKLVSGLAAKGMKTAKVDATLIPFLENLAFSAMLVFVAIAALANLGVEMTSVIAMLGAAGLAVGLALQGSLANFASGVLLLVFKPFRVGDFVEIGGAEGAVQAIHVFNTVINTSDNVRVVVPNAQVTGGSIRNYTINGTRRVDLIVSVSYSDDLKKARRVLESVLAQDERVLADPAPVVAVAKMGESSIDLVVRPWIKVARMADYWSAYFALTEKCKLAIEEHGMTIPFPQRDINIKSAASAANLVKSA